MWRHRWHELAVTRSECLGVNNVANERVCQKPGERTTRQLVLDEQERRLANRTGWQMTCTRERVVVSLSRMQCDVLKGPFITSPTVPGFSISPLKQVY